MFSYRVALIFENLVVGHSRGLFEGLLKPRDIHVDVILACEHPKFAVLTYFIIQKAYKAVLKVILNSS